MRKKLIILSVLIPAIAVAAVLIVLLAYNYYTNPTVVLTLLGDTGLGLEPPAMQVIGEKGIGAPFEHIRKSLRHSDFIIGNLETPIGCENLRPMRRRKPPRQPKEAAEEYAKQGIYAFSLANNHAMDYGLPGLEQTLGYLHQAGIQTFGAGSNLAEAGKPLIVQSDDIKIGILGICQRWAGHNFLYAAEDKPGVLPLRTLILQERIEALDAEVDFIILFVHWGRNFHDVKFYQRQYAAIAIEAGADLVVGHHPHIPQHVEIIDGVPVLYSLGHFVFHGLAGDGWYEDTGMDYSLVARCTFGKDGLQTIKLVPYFNNNRRTDFTPIPAQAEEAQDLFGNLLKPIDGYWRMKGPVAIIDLRKKS